MVKKSRMRKIELKSKYLHFYRREIRPKNEEKSMFLHSLYTNLKIALLSE